MKIRLYNARILTMEEGRPILEGEVWTDGDRIRYVGEPPGPLRLWPLTGRSTAAATFSCPASRMPTRTAP